MVAIMVVPAFKIYITVLPEFMVFITERTVFPWGSGRADEGRNVRSPE